MLYFLRLIKDVHLLFASKREEERKIFEHQEGLSEKNYFLYLVKSFATTKKIQFIIIAFQTQFTDTKRTVKRKPMEASHFRESHSFY